MNQTETPASLIMIFGATGDLAKRKLYPSLYHLYRKGMLAKHFAVIGVARRPWSNETLRDHVKSSVLDSIENADNVDEFITHFYYQPHDVSKSESYIELNESGKQARCQVFT